MCISYKLFSLILFDHLYKLMYKKINSIRYYNTLNLQIIFQLKT